MVYADNRRLCRADAWAGKQQQIYCQNWRADSAESPQYREDARAKTVLALMNVDSVSPEELEAAISYYTQALDDPKRVMEAAATLPYMLYAMGLVGVYPERIKALAELLEEKTKDIDDLPYSFYSGIENVFHNLGEYDKALFYVQRALEMTEKTRARILRRCTTIFS